MGQEDPEQVAALRRAIEDLTATVSDFQGESEGLAAERWNAFIDEMLAKGTAGVADVGALLNGYRQLALKLVLELAKAREVEPQTVMRGAGRWTTAME